MKAERVFTIGTIITHICFLVEKKLIKDIDKLVDEKKQEKIKEAIEKVGTDTLAPIKEELGDDITYDEIKIVRSLGLVKK